MDSEGYRSGAGYLISITPEGNILWKQKLKRRRAFPPAIASDGTIYLAIESSSRRVEKTVGDEGDYRDYLANLVAFSPDGDVEWVVKLEGTIEGLHNQDKILVDGNDDILLYQSGGWFELPHFYKISSDGDILWHITESEQDIESFTLAPDERLYVYADGEVIAYGDELPNADELTTTDEGRHQLQRTTRRIGATADTVRCFIYYSENCSPRKYLRAISLRRPAQGVPSTSTLPSIMM